jgi:hypothetical protein
MEVRKMGTGWTYAEFARLPSEGGARHEVVAGELVVTPAPSLRHQEIVTDLATRLSLFVRGHDLGHGSPSAGSPPAVHRVHPTRPYGRRGHRRESCTEPVDFAGAATAAAGD